METREKKIEIVAKAMCRVFYSTRSIEEAVAPSVQLWQRFEKEATVAVDALLQSSPPAGNEGMTKLIERLEDAAEHVDTEDEEHRQLLREAAAALSGGRS